MKQSLFLKPTSPYLPARALLYVLFITLLIALVSGSLISLAYLKNIQINDNLLQLRLVRNVASGITLLKASSENTINQTIIDLYDTQQDSILFEKRNWGLYQIGLVEAYKWNRLQQVTLQKAVILGDTLQTEQQAALYIKDNNKSLAVVGNTRIKGTAYLPRAGIKQGYIDGIGFTGKKSLDGETKRSKRHLPLVQTQRLEDLLLSLFTPITIEPNQPFMDSLHHSFFEPTYHITGNTVYLKNTVLKGNIVIQADSVIYVAADSYLEDVLLFAPYVIFEKGFKGRCQTFASEYIQVQEDCNLQYPSILCLLQAATSTENATIDLKKHSTVNGLVLYHQFVSSDVPKQFKIPESVVINGQVYLDGILQMKGKVKGNITCQGFKVQTPSSIYANHLLNVTIDYTQLQTGFLSPVFLKDGIGNKIIIQVY